MCDEEKHDWQPEPYTSDDFGHVYDANGDHITAFNTEMTIATAKRVKACINACQGIPTKDLELWVLTPGYIAKASRTFDAYERSTLGKE